jgi:hypothetical protein
MKRNKVRCALVLLRFLQACAARKCSGRSRGVVCSPAISSPHRLSLAGCSPAWPASVSPDAKSLQAALGRATLVAQALLRNHNEEGRQ